MYYLFVLSRVIFGGYFIWSGLNHFISLQAMTGFAASKKLPSPRLSVVLSGLMMIIGGLGILFWFQVQISVLLIVLFLLVASFTIHNFWTLSDPMAKMGDRVNFMKNIALIGGALAFLFTVY